MREYETVYIMDPALTDAKQGEIAERLQGAISRTNGRFFFSRPMGKKDLAYAIQKQTKGIYTCLDYAGPGPIVTEVERALRFDESILRFLTVVKNDEVDVEARAAEIIARGEDRAVETEEIPASTSYGDADMSDMKEDR